MSELPKVIYVMGPPGAGKGTQAKMLAEKIGYHQFSTGDAFRAITRQDTPLGRKVKEIIDNGFLCPPELAAEVVITAIQNNVKGGQGLIFDGTPRTVKEAQIVDEFFEKQGYGRPLAIRLVVDKEDMIERNSKRRYCLDVQGDFPVNTSEDEKRCAELGGRIGIRPDDESRNKIETRWSQFEENTLPVIEQYTLEGILHEVDGKRPIEEVQRDVVAIIEKIQQS